MCLSLSVPLESCSDIHNVQHLASLIFVKIPTNISITKLGSPDILP